MDLEELSLVAERRGGRDGRGDLMRRRKPTARHKQ
jgi:hypothetical protein